MTNGPSLADKCTEALMLMLCTRVIDFYGVAPDLHLLRGSKT